MGIKNLEVLKDGHDPDHLCGHGKKLWWNFGDGKPRHMSEYGPSGGICNDPKE